MKKILTYLLMVVIFLTSCSINSKTAKEAPDIKVMDYAEVKSALNSKGITDEMLKNLKDLGFSDEELAYIYSVAKFDKEENVIASFIKKDYKKVFKSTDRKKGAAINSAKFMIEYLYRLSKVRDIDKELEYIANAALQAGNKASIRHTIAFLFSLEYTTGLLIEEDIKALVEGGRLMSDTEYEEKVKRVEEIEHIALFYGSIAKILADEVSDYDNYEFTKLSVTDIDSENIFAGDYHIEYQGVGRRMYAADSREFAINVNADVDCYIFNDGKFLRYGRNKEGIRNLLKGTLSINEGNFISSRLYFISDIYKYDGRWLKEETDFLTENMNSTIFRQGMACSMSTDDLIYRTMSVSIYSTDVAGALSAWMYEEADIKGYGMRDLKLGHLLKDPEVMEQREIEEFGKWLDKEIATGKCDKELKDVWDGNIGNNEIPIGKIYDYIYELSDLANKYLRSRGKDVDIRFGHAISYYIYERGYYEKDFR